MRRVVQAGVVLGVLAALAAAPVVAGALPEAETHEAQVTEPQFLPDLIPPAQRAQQSASAVDHGGAGRLGAG